jgi:hypothetical protein
LRQQQQAVEAAAQSWPLHAHTQLWSRHSCSTAAHRAVSATLNLEPTCCQLVHLVDADSTAAAPQRLALLAAQLTMLSLVVSAGARLLHDDGVSCQAADHARCPWWAAAPQPVECWQLCWRCASVMVA